MIPENPITWFILQPLPLQLAVGGLALAAIQQFNQGHIGRVGIATAAILVIQMAYPIWGNLAPIWRIYTLISVIFGGVATVSYLTKTSLNTQFYRTAFWLYGGVTIILVMIYGMPI